MRKLPVEVREGQNRETGRPLWLLLRRQRGREQVQEKQSKTEQQVTGSWPAVAPPMPKAAYEAEHRTGRSGRGSVPPHAISAQFPGRKQTSRSCGRPEGPLREAVRL
ncbi:Hypothetical predicted protein [Marmota monax]|uniref:Uncharacterized protein n=1 Tax=Marmota monax TaxID=9995 RepID=A0A5E4AHW9_MARMO|nr:hypothetical protein GHT09_016571 [Marmota monax]VTJ56838.1 Hypothetical predicted protein [Marmota monax]